MMFSTETASMLVEFAEQRGGNKVTFLRHEVGKPSDIAKHEGQGSPEGSLCFHPSHSKSTRGASFVRENGVLYVQLYSVSPSLTTTVKRSVGLSAEIEQFNISDRGCRVTNLR
jgi:hypothetical protein